PSGEPRALPPGCRAQRPLGSVRAPFRPIAASRVLCPAPQMQPGPYATIDAQFVPDWAWASISAARPGATQYGPRPVQLLCPAAHFLAIYLALILGVSLVGRIVGVELVLVLGLLVLARH